MNTPFRILDAAAWFELATKAANRVKIYSSCWHEGEFACVLGSNPADAAQKALRVAETVAETRRVLLFDLQGDLRNYAACARAPRKLLRVNLDLASLDPKDIDGLMTGIEQTITASGAGVCVIDSLFFLCEWYCKSGATCYFITRFREMSRRLGISMLVGATARRRIGKTGPTAEHLPKGTAPFIDSIITDVAAEGAESAGSTAEAAHPDTPPSENSASAELPDIPVGFLSEEVPTAAPLPRHPSTIRRKKRRR